MAWYDIASLNYDGVHINGYLADLVTVYDHLRAVELAALGSYKTTGWVPEHGSPTTCGYPHFSIVHSVLGNTNIALATNWLRTQIGVAAYTWDTVTPSDPRTTPVGQRTILDFFCAIGRAETSGYSQNGTNAGTGAMTVTSLAGSTYSIGQKGQNCSGSTSDTIETPSVVTAESYAASKKWKKTTAFSLQPIETNYNATLCFQYEPVSLPSLSPTASSYSNWFWSATVTHQNFDLSTGTDYNSTDTDSATESRTPPDAAWNNDGTNYWIELDHTPVLSDLSNAAIYGQIQDYLNAVSAAQSVYNGITIACPGGDPVQRSLGAYMNTFGGGNTEMLTATSGSNLVNVKPNNTFSYAYWTESPKDYSYS